MFRRSGILHWGAISLLAVSVWSQPVLAEEGELIAQDTKAQINVRSLANTDADIIAAGSVGDHVQILAHSTGNDGLTWYRVKLSKSGQSGWIRGDLIKVFGSPKPQSPPKPTATHPAKPSAAKPPVPLAPPQLSASAKSIAPSPASPVKQPPEKPVAEIGQTTPEKPIVAEPPKAIAPNPTANPTPATTTPTSESTTTIVAFKTSTYAVRIFSDAGQLRLNLFNRKTDRIALKAVPVESKSTEEGTLYNYGTDAKVTVVVPLSGQPALIATALGETLKEDAETTPETAPKPTSPTP